MIAKNYRSVWLSWRWCCCTPIGAASEVEMKEKKARVGMLYATRAAVKKVLFRAVA